MTVTEGLADVEADEETLGDVLDVSHGDDEPLLMALCDADTEADADTEMLPLLQGEAEKELETEVEKLEELLRLEQDDEE